MGSGSADGQVRLVPAGSVEPAALTEVFNLGFSGYLVPLQMDEDGLREHVAVNDIDVDRSIVAVGAEPVGLVLTGGRTPRSSTCASGARP